MSKYNRRLPKQINREDDVMTNTTLPSPISKRMDEFLEREKEESCPIKQEGQKIKAEDPTLWWRENFRV